MFQKRYHNDQHQWRPGSITRSVSILLTSWLCGIRKFDIPSENSSHKRQSPEWPSSEMFTAIYAYTGMCTSQKDLRESKACWPENKYGWGDNIHERQWNGSNVVGSNQDSWLMLKCIFGQATIRTKMGKDHILCGTISCKHFLRADCLHYRKIIITQK